MDCKYFGKCASCTLYDKTYEEQLEYKKQREKNRFSDFEIPNIEIIKSEEKHFRTRAEFRIWKNFDDENNPTISYAMNDFNKNSLEIDSCQIVSESIFNLMPKLLERIKNNEELKFKLFAVEFLNSTIDDMLVTLIYHKKLEESWLQEAKELEKELNIKIIGRSRKQKEVLSEDFINETLIIQDKPFYFQYKEGGFTQPNTNVNVKMIEWVLRNIEKSEKDLCELYCGGGNFTIPLSQKFNKVLATEISKTSIKSALTNCSLNNISNIDFIRMSAEEFVEALESKREFRRLKDIDLKMYNFDTIFVDPPRAGLDDTTRALSKQFETIIYISCNPETLHRDLKELTKTHKIINYALFDQFSYTEHIESGVILNKI
ncbi:tRNA (uridine(54)-C5)-methyltransferase TrmA [Halarcobacter bivalviorum]|uniref:tRNA (Uridine(54)-C5)-methyltransferase TrmA n=1 Tax=Halarcobacter bivalviorum TaxID=663364 RepID=A0AAX2A6T2_9BACT|nr:tRNA (uridine(54)-C5)-methyltransferase TrmA [Halarcobacter bivalviorum]AXH13438.1 tRNA m5U54 methyltransferase [Halarcobacter bivalviorum]RXK09964.1 tRNA (uridine(54)-C5)-methyltransferase TrmA [Halarcobacter bivalviorum]